VNKGKVCLILGCASAAGGGTLFCHMHGSVVEKKLGARVASLSKRREILRTFSAQDERFNQVLESGRYLKLAHAICCVDEAIDLSVEHMVKMLPVKIDGSSTRHVNI
jgi:hypothetical protein